MLQRQSGLTHAVGGVTAKFSRTLTINYSPLPPLNLLPTPMMILKKFLHELKLEALDEGDYRYPSLSKASNFIVAVSFTKFFTTLGFLKMCGLCVCCCSVWLIQFEMYNVSGS